MTNNSLYQKVGANIRKLRNEQKLTIAQLAEFADIGDYYMGEIERAEKRATLETFSKIAEALGVDLYLLFKFD